MQTSRRSFLSFSIFEGLCLRQAGVSSPIQLTPDETWWGIFDGDECFGMGLNHAFVEKLSTLWLFDYILHRTYVISGSWNFCFPNKIKDPNRILKIIEERCPAIIEMVPRKNDFFKGVANLRRPNIDQIKAVAKALGMNPLSVKKIDDPNLYIYEDSYPQIIKTCDGVDAVLYNNRY